MNRLTHERKNGIKQGHWSPNNKQELVDRLALYEDAAGQKSRVMTMLTQTVCDKYCRYPVECEDQDKLDTHCNSCQLVHIWNAIMCIEPDKAKINLDKFKDIDYVAKLLNEYNACSDEVCFNSLHNKDGDCTFEPNIQTENCIECTKLWLMKEIIRNVGTSQS